MMYTFVFVLRNEILNVYSIYDIISVSYSIVSSLYRLQNAMKNCDVVFHCAALTDLMQPWEQFLDVIVEGTRRVLQAAANNKIRKVIHVSSEASLMKGFGSPLVNVTEADELPDPEIEQGQLFYSRSKNMAERVCSEFAATHNTGEYKCEVIIVRPRFIWGCGDTLILPKLIEQAKSTLGFAYVGGGVCMTSTVNISNCIHGMLLASQYGRSGQAYFITDSENSSYRSFFCQLFTTQGIDGSNFPSLPIYLAQWIAWTGLIPDLTVQSLALLGQEVTVVHDKARKELMYAHHCS